jgi:hypothetical protein
MSGKSVHRHCGEDDRVVDHRIVISCKLTHVCMARHPRMWKVRL